jgi:hypothetical protein
MAKSFVVTRRPPPVRILVEQYREEVRKDLEKVAKSHVKSREQVVANWSARSKPTFKARTVVTVGRIGIEVTVIEADKGKPIWKWVSQTGTRKHPIPPKPTNKSKRLFFKWGGPGSYDSKTKASPARFGGPGVVRGGRLTVAKSVNHPGFKPRGFDKIINKDLQDDFKAAVKNGGSRGLKKARGRR